eukprot:Phypoly_transcript_11395.p2 GENE.Phypoly_transcript_11395~~Phypoly_transcript_11395.p2  ORF type:complete len:156 (+),score=18.89 Phypoly_transcript_11395:486-953(+)
MEKKVNNGKGGAVFPIVFESGMFSCPPPPFPLSFVCELFATSFFPHIISRIIISHIQSLHIYHALFSSRIIYLTHYLSHALFISRIIYLTNYLSRALFISRIIYLARIIISRIIISRIIISHFFSRMKFLAHSQIISHTVSRMIGTRSISHTPYG